MIVLNPQQQAETELQRAIGENGRRTVLLPESAPFSPEQRAWLNGFFAGLLGIAESAEGHDQEPHAGQRTESSSDASGDATTTAEESFPWHDPALPLEDRLQLAEDRPFERRLMSAMAQLDCGACGYLCKTYAESIASGAERNLGLCAPGGAGTARALKRLLKAASATPGSANTSTAPPPVVVPPQPPEEIPARVTLVRRLTAGTSAKHVSHVELDISETRSTYECGDSLAVLPRNCPQLMGGLLERLRWPGDAPVGGEGHPQRPLADVLLEQCDLRQVTDALLELLIAAAPHAAAIQIWRQWLDEGPPEGADVLEVLEHLPASVSPLEPTSVVGCLAPLMPRYYSIASSPLLHRRSVHLTVGRVAQPIRGRLRKGVASTLLCERLDPGDTLRVFVKATPEFRLPSEHDRPLIMIGPGTGIAPFVGFLQHRQAQGARGKNWLFFGEQHRSTDFLYESELAAFQAQGVLQRLDLAFSRDQPQKIYVQQRMRESGTEVYRWLEEGCGDARRMARDVDQALQDIVLGCQGRSATAARQYIDDLKAQGRYRRDVY
jgi:sulfite reductase (NADPH) flavoprotein alpha-component